MFYFHLLLLLLLLPAVFAQDENPVACLESGACFQGSYGTTSSGRVYASYQGIRYAEPPTGSRRFLAPEPHHPEEGLWDVSSESTIACPQKSSWYDPWEVVGQEDCLFLNVYSPENHQQAPLPVMVWIHGGALLAGAGTFQEHGPQHLLDKEVIVVTLNYRLGALGFLCLGSDVVPGNAGLRDQALALHWVKENIGQFGGDAGRVTIFGESAGSGSVSLQLLSPLAESTFQRAILQSGTALGISWGAPNTPQKALQYAAVFSTSVGCGEGCGDDADVLTCLQGVEVRDTVALTDIFPDQASFPWQAVPDSLFTTSPFLPAPAEELLQSGQFNSEVEVILGTCNDEGLSDLLGAWTDPEFFETIRDTWDTAGAARILGLMRYSDVTPADVEKAHKIIDAYVGGVENITMSNVQSLIDMMTDSSMLYGVHKKIGYLLEQGMTVYQYVLTHKGQFSIAQLHTMLLDGTPQTHGVAHADDLIYEWEPVFGSSGWDTETHQLSGDDARVRDILTGAWASFATSGKPGLGWTPVQSDHTIPTYLNISGPNPTMDSSQDLADRMMVWQTVVG